jgi:hypothetical protein
MFETGMNDRAAKESDGARPMCARYRNQAEETGTRTGTRTGAANREHNEKREIGHGSKNTDRREEHHSGKTAGGGNKH